MSIPSVRWILRFYNYWSAARPLAFLRHCFGWFSGSVIGLLFLYGLTNLAGSLALGRLGDRYGKERAVRVGQITELAAPLVLALALWQDARIMLVAALCVFAFS
jgi:predicted MFS family arabinose efflux permease